jgi:transient receptor potential cation channel subfamily V protein 5
MVTYLLLNGANVHQRCCGNFFRPDDQKNKAIDLLEHEFPLLPVQSNYAGLSYFGEYPLSFAAVTKQEDCVRLLLAKNADPNKQDSNGNTVLHMLVIHDLTVIFTSKNQFRKMNVFF